MSDTLKRRIEWIDAAKGIGIILVIFAHINSGTIGKWIYSFHMPLFLILSGCTFNGKCSFKVFLKKKFKSIIVPYVCLGTIMALFQIGRNYFEGNFSVHASLVIFAELAMQIRYWTLWYIACLLGLNLLFYFLTRFVKNNWLLGMIVFFLTAGGGILRKAFPAVFTMEY